MKDRTGCLIGLLCLIGLTNLVGIYFIIDSQSRFTQAVAENKNALNDVRAELSKVRITPANGNAANTAAQVVTTTEEFANAEFYQPQRQEGGRRVSYTSTFAGGLNYVILNEATVSVIWETITDGLATRNLMENGTFEPMLAKKWDVSEDGLTYTITLRKGVLWHPYTDLVTKKKVPAKEVTADDFMFLWEIFQNEDIPCDPWRSTVKLVKTFEKVDRYTFKVIWAEPYCKAEETTLNLIPIPRHYYRPNPNWDDKEFAQQFISSVRNQFAIGCGAYRLAEWKKGDSMTFERFEQYYGIKPAIKTLKIREISDSNIALVELHKGGIDSMGLTPEQWIKETVDKDFHLVTPDADTAVEDSAQWDDLKQAGKTPDDYKFDKFQYISSAPSWMYIGWNLEREIFKDKRTRQALTMLTDRKKILKDVYYDLGILSTGPFPVTSDYADPSVKPFPFDPAAAKKLLTEAGWTDSDKDGILDITVDGKKLDFKFSVMIPSSAETYRKMMSIVQSDMRKAGIDLQIRPTEWSVFLERLNKKEFDACSLGWTGSLEPDPYQVWHSDSAKVERPSNFISFMNEKADELIDKGRRETDRNKRLKIFREFYRLVHDEQPYTFLFALSSLRAQSKRYYNARVYPLGMDGKTQWVPSKLQLTK